MKRILLAHLYSAILVSLFILGLAVALKPAVKRAPQLSPLLLNLQALDLNPDDAFQSILFKEMARTLAGADSNRYLSLWQQLAAQQKSEDLMAQKETARRLAYRKSAGVLLWMYIKFLMVFVLVMALSYYGVQTLGLYFFIRHQQLKPPQFYHLFFLIRQWLLAPGKKLALKILKNMFFLAGKALFYLLFFAPAYVVAYSIKTDFTSQSLLFLIVLGVLTNGLLITYAYKFYHFLLNESRKGYVRTAIVKNLNQQYDLGSRGGLHWRQVLAPQKQFKGHVLQHIYMNSVFQYLATFKEQAAFVITSLVIIEMALNIHGHLSYELLQQLLYRNFDLALFIVLGLYLIVKATEVFTDLMIFKQQQKLEVV